MVLTTPQLFDVLTATASELQAKLTAGSLTSVQIASSYLSQIEKHNHAGVKLNAMITVAPAEKVRKWAEELDRERGERKLRGPLHGLPIIVKDVFWMGQELGMKTTAGAYCFAEEKAKKSATIISQLREQGLIILGTTNLSEFCAHKAQDMTPGWSAYGGQTKSAYDPTSFDENPKQIGLASLCGGSSSGSAVGISAGFAPLSLGTDTGGSVIYPAVKAGMYGMRPTLGSVSSDGVFRCTRSFDGVGPMARTPLDLAHLVETILTPTARGKVPSDGFASALKGSWEGLRVGFAESTWESGNKEKWESRHVLDHYESVAAKINEQGGHALYPVAMPSTSTLEHNGIKFRQIVYHEFKTVVQEFCSGFENARIQNTDDIIEFNEKNSELALPEPHHDQDELYKSKNDSFSDDQCQAAYQEIKRLAGREGIDKGMEEHGLDVIVANSDCNLVIFGAFTGYPTASAPLGNLEDGSPFGIFLLAKEGREDLLFRFLSAFERTFERVEGPKLP